MSNQKFIVRRQIGIDAGHRVMTHGSKCRNMHGHRYTIEAHCQTDTNKLHNTGEQTDMVIDFSFLKDEMMTHIDEPCDHGFIISVQDEQLLKMFAPKNIIFETQNPILQNTMIADVCREILMQTADELYGVFR